MAPRGDVITELLDRTSETLRDDISTFFNDLARFADDGQRVIASSSFQTQSMPMLHLLSLAPEPVPIYFLDTGFHFPETLAFRDVVSDHLALDVHILESSVPKVAQRTDGGRFFWTEDTERCCAINKTAPMEPVLAGTDVWITGVRRDQGPTRAAFDREMLGAHGIVRYHPMLEWTKRDVWKWVSDHDLPRHPLELQGYDSIGCQPCTMAPDPFGERSGRWNGQFKTECGLHTTLAAAGQTPISFT